MRNGKNGESITEQGRSGSTDSGIDFPNSDLNSPDEIFLDVDGNNDSYLPSSHPSYSCPTSPTPQRSGSPTYYLSTTDLSIDPQITDRDYQRNCIIVSETAEESDSEELQTSAANSLLSNSTFSENFKNSLKVHIYSLNESLVRDFCRGSRFSWPITPTEENIKHIISFINKKKWARLIDDVTAELLVQDELTSVLCTLLSDLPPSRFKEVAEKLAGTLIESYKNSTSVVAAEAPADQCKAVNDLLAEVMRKGFEFSAVLLTNYAAQIPIYADRLFKDYALEAATTYFNTSSADDLPDCFQHAIKECLYELSRDTLAKSCAAILPGIISNELSINLSLNSDNKAFIESHSKEILDAYCIEYFSPAGQNDINPEYIIDKIESALTKCKLVANHFDAQIESAVSEIVSEVLTEDNIKNALAKVKDSHAPNEQGNLKECIDAQLKVQVDQWIDSKIPTYIFKEKHNERVDIFQRIIQDPTQTPSDAELLALLQEQLSLRYADSKEDFFLALSTIYPEVAYPDDFTMPDKLFLQVRKLLRSKDLEEINAQHPESCENYNAEGITELNTQYWLKKKCQLISGKLINLKLNADEQEKFNRRCEIQKKYHLSKLNLAAVTHKSVDELKEELAKLADLKRELVIQRHHCLSTIEKTLLNYPKLINREDFRASLNTALTELAFSEDEEQATFQVNTAQAAALLQGINQHIAYSTINHEWALFKLNLMPQLVATTGTQGLNQRVLPYQNKWNSLKNDWNSRVLNPIVGKIYTVIQPTFTSADNGLSESKAKSLISTAINLLLNQHGLKDKLQEREEWSNDVKNDYAMLENVKTCSEKIAHRASILEEMKTQKETEQQPPSPPPVKVAVSATPGPVYLPSSCYVLGGKQGNFSLGVLNSNNKRFTRRDKLLDEQVITYRQVSDDRMRHQDWSVSYKDAMGLAYQTKKVWYQRSSKKLQKEVCFTQMIDAVNSFKDSSVIDFSFSYNCSREDERQYRLFISAYNELRWECSLKNPILYCGPNDKLKTNEAEMAAAKNEIKDQLNLYAHESENILRNLSASCGRGRI